MNIAQEILNYWLDNNDLYTDRVFTITLNENLEIVEKQSLLEYFSYLKAIFPVYLAFIFPYFVPFNNFISTEVSFINVGQGDSILIKSKHSTIMIS